MKTKTKPSKFSTKKKNIVASAKKLPDGKIVVNVVENYQGYPLTRSNLL